MAALEMARGDSLSLNLAVTSGGVPLTLVGKSLRFVAKRGVGDSDASAVITKTTPTGIVVTDAPGGLARIDLLPADTSALPALPELLVWDIQLINGSAVYTIESGTLLVKPDVSVTV